MRPYKELYWSEAREGGAGWEMPAEEPGGGLPRCPVLPGPTRSVK